MKHLNQHKFILASGSPRRQQFLKDLNIPFEIRLKAIEENFPDTLYKEEIPEYLAKLKANAYDDLASNEILITGDTIVWHNEKALNKAEDKQEAFDMISSLQNSWHHVISAFCLKTNDRLVVKSEVTKVFFDTLDDKDIWYYVNNYKPFDKAGAYGIQEWIGQIGISKIKGSYFNVMGFPTHLFYQTLKEFIR
ncbi:Maf family nucleotide pyrophosphatase [Psychroflexus sp. MBR-150]|jgi:septum formation protein